MSWDDRHGNRPGAIEGEMILEALQSHYARLVEEMQHDREDELEREVDAEAREILAELMAVLASDASR